MANKQKAPGEELIILIRGNDNGRKKYEKGST